MPLTNPYTAPQIRLVASHVGFPVRNSALDADTQCDCACFSMTGVPMPTLDHPITFFLELTADCNNRCPTCGNVFADCAAEWSEITRTSGMSAAEWDTVLDKIEPCAYRLKVTGGEPTQAECFEPVVESVSRRGIPFTLFTNGRWQSPLQLLAFLDTLPALEGLLVSLHGPSASTHEAFSNVPGSFSETAANISLATSMGIRVSLSCVLTNLNCHLTKEMALLAIELGASGVVFNRHLGIDTNALAAGEAELLDALDTIEHLRLGGASVKLGNCIPSCFSPNAQSGCLAGVTFFTVDPWGLVRPCNHASQVCGNLRQQSIQEVWKSPGMERWRNSYPAQCQECTAFSSCRGGCRAQAMSMSVQQDPLCRSRVHDVPPVEQWTIYEKARPVKHFDQIAESFGQLLVSGNHIFPIPKNMEPVLEALDLETTLLDIDTTFGSDGLSLIAALYQHHMLNLVT